MGKFGCWFRVISAPTTAAVIMSLSMTFPLRFATQIPGTPVHQDRAPGTVSGEVTFLLFVRRDHTCARRVCNENRMVEDACRRWDVRMDVGFNDFVRSKLHLA